MLNGDDGDRTGNLLVANQVVRPYAKCVPHNGFDAFCGHWSFSRVSGEFACFMRVYRGFGAAVLILMGCPVFEKVRPREQLLLIRARGTPRPPERGSGRIGEWPRRRDSQWRRPILERLIRTAGGHLGREAADQHWR